MDPSVLGTGQLVLSRASSAPHRLPVRPPLPPGCADSGCTPLVGSSCVVQDVGRRSAKLLHGPAAGLRPPAAPPTCRCSSPTGATPPTPPSSASTGPDLTTALPENITTINPNPVNVNTPALQLLLLQQRHVVCHCVARPEYAWSATATTGWTETQPDGTSFNFDNTGVLRTIRNRAGVRWTLTWDSGFNHVQSHPGPVRPPHDLHVQRCRI